MSDRTYHTPVLLREVLDVIKPCEREIILDCTLGGGGHSSEMLKAMKAGGRLYGIDRDADAIEEATSRINEELPDRAKDFTPIRGNFFNAKELMAAQGVEKADAILCDLGVSSRQFDNGSRGFSHRAEAKLEMRMDRSESFTAYDIVNGYPEHELRRIFYEYGEEKFSPAIARNIVKQRAIKPIETTTELVEIIKSSMPAKALKEKGHPASRVFQALRIETNGEIKGLSEAVKSLADMLSSGGVMAVITFHSIEDRIIKNTFRELQNPCTCPPSAPVCVCGKKPVVDIILKKPVTAGDEELERNPRARSAKLRAVKKL